MGKRSAARAAGRPCDHVAVLRAARWLSAHVARRRVRFLLAPALITGLPMLLGGHPATGATVATSPTWMIERGAVGLVENYLGNATLVTRAFDASSTLEIGSPSGSWTAQRVDSFTAYGPATSVGTFLYALKNGTIPAGTTYVSYDDEGWSLTPLVEQRSPGTYMADFVSTAHQHGYKAILAPAVDLTDAMPCRVSTDPSWKNYLTDCDLPRLVTAAHPDIFEIQAQRFENNTSSSTKCGCFRWFVGQAQAEATSATPIAAVFAGLSTDPGGSTTTGQVLATDTTATLGTVSGYWLNVPVQSVACPTCTSTGDPGVAADYLWDLGYVGPGSQTISFQVPASVTRGATTSLSATGGRSGNPVRFSLDPSSGPGVCTLSGTNDATVTFAEVGTCVIDANQAASSDWLAAPEVTRTTSVVQA